jgi:hypothetical protein
MPLLEVNDKPTYLPKLKAPHIDGSAIGQRHHRAVVTRRWHTSSSRAMASRRRCMMTVCSRSVRCSGSTRAAKHPARNVRSWRLAHV